MFRLKVGVSLSKKFALFASLKTLKNGFHFILKSSFRSQDIQVFIMTIRSCSKNGFIRKTRLIFKTHDVTICNTHATQWTKPYCKQKIQLLHDGGPNHIEISPLICYANQWTDFYMIGASVMKELKVWRRVRQKRDKNI